MTREEQAKYISEKLMENPEFRKTFVGAITDAINVVVKAINALEQEPRDDATLRDIFCMGCEYKEQEPCDDMGEVSDGYHTFNQLYHQRAVLFATIVNQNKDKSWKSFKHSDGKYCFDSNGEWFIVGIDTPQGSYTYHYAKEYWDMFDCEELECGKEWDGHTEEDVIRLLSLQNEPCTDAISKQAVAEVLLKYAHSAEGKAFAEFLISQINDLPPVKPQYTDAEIQKMQDLEFAEIQKAYEIGKDEGSSEWIPVSERLPEAWRYVNCTCHSLVDDREDWVIETCYVPQPKGSPYSDWGNIVMLNDGECEVVAWMYRDIPDPYNASPTGEEVEE